MNRTHASSVIAVALGGGIVAFLLELGIVSAGRPVIVPPVSLPVTLIAVGVIVVGFAWPIQRAVHGTSPLRIDAFQALRVAMLAKASSLAGAAGAGAGAGVLVFLLSRSVVAASASLWMAGATAIGGVVLVVGGLVAEHFCTLPPGDDPDDPDAPEEAHV